MSVVFAFLHHLAAFVLLASLFLELVLVKGELTSWSARKILLYDRVYGIAAVLLLLAGSLRVARFEKGAHYYFHNLPFLVKISLFLLVVLVSVYPTREFLSWRAALSGGGVPVLDERKRRRLSLIIHGELTAIVMIMLCAALMAKGVGSFG
jgi:putative membrane protein